MKLTESKLKTLIVETLQEGFMDWYNAKEAAHNRAKNIRALSQKDPPEATRAEVRAAFEEYDKIEKNRYQFYSPEEEAEERADNERRNREQDARDRAREDDEAASEKRRADAKTAAMMSTKPGYADRGIRMDPDDPGDVDDIYPQRR